MTGFGSKHQAVPNPGHPDVEEVGEATGQKAQQSRQGINTAEHTADAKHRMGAPPYALARLAEVLHKEHAVEVMGQLGMAGTKPNCRLTLQRRVAKVSPGVDDVGDPT